MATPDCEITILSQDFLVCYLKTKSITINNLIDKRDFLDLSTVSTSNSIDAKVLDKKLSGLQWITILYPDNPNKEIAQLKEAIQIIKNDRSNKILVTDYQFISVILESYDYSPNKYWYEHHVYPTKNERYFEVYKKFFIDHLIKNKIQSIYIIKPLWGDKNVLESILNESCVRKTSLTEILDKNLLLECEALIK